MASSLTRARLPAPIDPAASGDRTAIPDTLGVGVAPPKVDDAVIRRAQRGDTAAFAQIVEEFQTPIYNYVLRLVRDHGLAEDLTQEIFFRVYERLGRFAFR